MSETVEITRYWHANCGGIDIDFVTDGEHKVESMDVHEFPFSCPRCGGEHVALEVSAAERKILKEQDSGGGKITEEMVKRLEQDTLGLVGEDDVLNVDVMVYLVTTYEDFDFVGNYCSWCDEQIDCPAEVYLWGEPIGGNHVAINTFHDEECLRNRLDSYQEKLGKSALLIKFRG